MLVALILAAGLMIGMTGIGGVLVVPALTDAAGVPLDRAIAAAMAGFLLTGIASLGLRRNRSASPSGGLWTLNVAALCGAVVGAAAVAFVPAAAIRLLIGAIAIASGVHALASRMPAEERNGALGRPALAAIGGMVGCGSALSGTGGPVMLLPLLMFLGVPVRTGIAMAQVIQLPIALSATGVNFAQGRLDLGLAGMVGALLVAGSLAGFWLATRVGTGALKRAVALALVALGLWYGYATFFGPGGAT